MDDCIFCKIIKGEVSAFMVYETDEFLAFLDANPDTKGHTLIVPKTHFRRTYEVPNFGEYFEVAKKVGLAALNGLGAKWLSFHTVGAEVPHAHIHVIPQYEETGHGAVVEKGEQVTFTDDQMKEIAGKIKDNL